MPSDYTKNYKLNQWAAEDKVLRTDFNADNLKIEDALNALAAADQTEIDARKALETTVNNKGNCTISTFTYTGNGNHGAANPTKVNFPRVPVAYIIYGDQIMVGRGGASSAVHIYYVQSSGAGIGPIPTTWSGGTLSMYNGTYAARQMNSSGTTYYVIAFYT